ncbi:MAG: FGGY family pentulose kinase [Arenimonas sp.]|nr:FGGY family pentulose kinase [Arenimonas sp.]
MRDYLMAVDVGTGSVRAGIFDLHGTQCARHTTPISLHQPQERHLEQDSEEIWRAVCRSARAAVEQAGLFGDDIAAIGFDATCSLVVRDQTGKPLSISTTGKENLDTLLWMDHRAAEQAERCNATEDPLLRRYGGRLSAEMQVPKLLWLKENMPAVWAEAGLIFDLCDYLTWRATGSSARSHSPLASKWGYTPEGPGTRPDDFYQLVGLDDLAERAGLPASALPPTKPVGSLSEWAANELGLSPACLVAPGLIDAYAGTVALFASRLATTGDGLETHAALIAGTSSCVVQLTNDERQAEGCWGAFRDVAIAGLWLTEAGQSASGALLDHMLRTHPAGGEPTQARHAQILDHIAKRRAVEGAGYGLPIHVLPDFHGTRSPTTDPDLTGTIAGMTLDRSFEGLCRLYWRTCVALACGIRHIIGQMPGEPDRIETLAIAGGFSHHPLIPQLYADVLGCTIMTPVDQDAVLLGTAQHAAVAGGLFADMAAAGRAMAIRTHATAPNAATRNHYERDYAALLIMMRHRAELAQLL